MSFLDHVRSCNRHDPDRFVPFYVAGQAVGRIHERQLAALEPVRPSFTVAPDAALLTPKPDTLETRSEALQRAVEHLVSEGLIRKLRGEHYPVMMRWGGPVLCQIDRGGVPFFGIPAFGLHVNGFVRMPNGDIELWIGRRSRDRGIAAGKLDNMVGGGQPVGLTLAENLIKEADEEASIDRELALTAKPVNVLTYTMQTEEGLKVDTLFVYDLELPANFVPVNRDGEVEGFTRLPLPEVAAIVRDTDDFKFNCNLVIIDFLIRHGFLHPDHEPDYVDIVTGMHRQPAPFP